MLSSVPELPHYLMDVKVDVGDVFYVTWLSIQTLVPMLSPPFPHSRDIKSAWWHCDVAVEYQDAELPPGAQSICNWETYLNMPVWCSDIANIDWRSKCHSCLCCMLCCLLLSNLWSAYFKATKTMVNCIFPENRLKQILSSPCVLWYDALIG